MPPKKKKKGGSWFETLQAQDLEVRSIRNAAAVTGWLDTGNYALNWAISGRFLRGYPLGHSVEMFGDPSTGKSYLVARALAMLQEQANGVALLDDTEGGYSAEWAEVLGVNIDEIPVRRSRTVADHLKTVQGFITAFEEYSSVVTDACGLVVCDSLAQLTTEHELEVELEKRDLSKSKELKTFFRIVGGRLIELPIVYICTNHVYDNIGNPFQKRTTPGGRGAKYQSSVRLDLRTPSKLIVDGEKVGVLVRVVVDKNRFTAPWKEVKLAIPFYQPISRASGLIPILLQLGILEESGNFVRYKGETTRIRSFKSKDKALRQDEEGERLLDLIPEILEETDVCLAKTHPGLVGALVEGDEGEEV